MNVPLLGVLLTEVISHNFWISVRCEVKYYYSLTKYSVALLQWRIFTLLLCNAKQLFAFVYWTYNKVAHDHFSEQHYSPRIEIYFGSRCYEWKQFEQFDLKRPFPQSEFMFVAIFLVYSCVSWYSFSSLL